MTDHVCAWAAASPARYRASSSAKAASMSSGSNVDARRDPVVGVDFDDVREPRCRMPRAAGRGPRSGSREGEALPRVAMTSDVDVLRRRSRRSARNIGDCAHLDRVGPRHSRPDGDHRSTISSATSPPSRPSRGPRSSVRDALVHSACRVFQLRRGRLSSSNLASAASRSASSNSSHATDQVAVDGRHVDLPPLGVESLLRGAL